MPCAPRLHERGRGGGGAGVAHARAALPTGSAFARSGRNPGEASVLIRRSGGGARFAGFVLLTGVVGFFLALIAYFLAFLRIVARSDWRQTVLLTAAAALSTVALAWSLNLVLPGGLLQEAFDLPWPLR